ncbi:unnamed protein product, partial [Schistosoma curassoni]|uniref:Uncharacterized protein n=1 Tax=Schistosoma curassoni TaxID=6186 RepID=A0A183KCS5_9TREM
MADHADKKEKIRGERTAQCGSPSWYSGYVEHVPPNTVYCSLPKSAWRTADRCIP